MGVLDKFRNSFRINNDDVDEEEEFYDEEDVAEEEETEKKPKKSFFKRIIGNRSKEEDDYDDEDEEEEEPAPKRSFFKRRDPEDEPERESSVSSSARASKVTPMRRRAGSMEVHVIKPTSFEDTQNIANTLLSGCIVVLNLEGIDVELAQRVIDFSSGASYTSNGNLQKVSAYIFVLTPHNVGITGDISDIIGSSVSTMRHNI